MILTNLFFHQDCPQILYVAKKRFFFLSFPHSKWAHKQRCATASLYKDVVRGSEAQKIIPQKIISNEKGEMSLGRETNKKEEEFWRRFEEAERRICKRMKERNVFISCVYELIMGLLFSWSTKNNIGLYLRYNLIVLLLWRLECIKLKKSSSTYFQDKKRWEWWRLFLFFWMKEINKLSCFL